MNSPGTLERMAPKFYEEWFNHLDLKPEVRDAYFEIQEILTGDREALVARRRAGVRKMFEDGDFKAKELAKQKEEERKRRQHEADRIGFLEDLREVDRMNRRLTGDS